MNSEIQYRPKIEKNYFSSSFSVQKQPHQSFFRKFSFFVFLRTHDILVDYATKFSLPTQNLKNANYKNTIKKFPCEWVSLSTQFLTLSNTWVSGLDPVNSILSYGVNSFHHLTRSGRFWNARWVTLNTHASGQGN